MSWRRFRRVLLIGLIAALALRAVRALRGPEAPAFTRHPSAWDGQVTQPLPATEAAPEPEAVVTEPAPDPTSAAATAGGEDRDGEATWLRPVDGECPPGHPIKAKERSGIYHEPGMFAYERTNPDRCYATAADAQADGFRAAKR